MGEIERRFAREAKAMTRGQVIKKALARELSWTQAASILRISTRQLRRLRSRVKQHGLEALVDRRGGKPRRKRISTTQLEKLLRLRRDKYREFSVRHFYEFAT